MKEYKNIIVIVLILLVIFFFLELVLQRVDKLITDEAINKCGKIASVTYETDEGKAKTTEPFKPAYDQCLEDKGIIR